MSQTLRRRQPACSGQVSPICDRLRILFDQVAAEPVPDQLNALADRLDGALERGGVWESKNL